MFQQAPGAGRSMEAIASCSTYRGRYQTVQESEKATANSHVATAKLHPEDGENLGIADLRCKLFEAGTVYCSVFAQHLAHRGSTLGWSLDTIVINNNQILVEKT